jgi:hypothetical protein
LVQHILELFLGSTLKANELESKSITILPTDDGKGDDDGRPGARRLHMKTDTRSDRRLDMTFDLTSSERKIDHSAMTGPLVSRE